MFGKGLMDELLGKFEQQRQNNGRIRKLSADVRYYSHQGLEVLGVDDEKGFEDACAKARHALIELDNIRSGSIPADLQWKYHGEAAQEYIELVMVGGIWNDILITHEGGIHSSSQPFQLMSPKEFSEEHNVVVASQEWIAGLLDTPTELGKVFTTFSLYMELDQRSHYEIGSAVVRSCHAILAFLQRFMEVYPLILNNNRYRGGSFPQRLRRVHNGVLAMTRENNQLRLQMETKRT